MSETMIHFSTQTLKMNGYGHFNPITLIFLCVKRVSQLALKREHVKSCKQLKC